MPIQPLSKLPFLKFRNVPSTLTLRQKAEFVRHDGFPSFDDPQHFVQTMERWEQALGTTYASLGGMIMMSGSPAVDQIIEGFEVFHGICQRLSPFLTGATLKHAQALFEEIKTKLIFEPDMPGMLEGLHNFDYNLNSEYYLTVGDCVVCAAMFSLLYSYSGGLSGEIHTINNPHTTAFLEPHEYYYDPTKDAPLRPVKNNKPLIISGIFSFLPTMTVMTNIKFSENVILGFLPKEKLEAMLHFLECAQAINPYHIEIYWRKESLLWALNRGKEAKFDAIYEALGNFGQKPVKAGAL